MEAELSTEYEVIVVGTGFVECIVAAASARVGKKVLHIDRNDYYGGQWASFTLQGMEQWLAVSKEQEGAENTEMPNLEEGEKCLTTCDPGRAYLNLKQSWNVPKKFDIPVKADSTLTEVQSKLEDEPAETETLDQSSAEEKSHGSEADGQTASDKLTDTTDKASCEVKGMDSAEANSIENQENVKMSVASPVEVVETRSWSQESMMQQSRRFNLDLAPKLLFSRGPLVELLISSNVARYAEFKCITRVLTWLASGEEDGELVVVPCSRSDVFTTNSVSLVEKRLLMKLLEFCHSYDQQPEQLEEFGDKTFVEFLKSRRQTPNLIHFVMESIAMVDEKVSCKEGLEKTKLFLTSLGRYGTTPFLFSMYGCGELPQAFCRLCAVFEGTYVLRRPISSIIINASNACVGIISEGVRFKCSHLVMDAMYSPQEYLSVSPDSSEKAVSRGIFITDRTILPNDKEQLTLLRMPAKGRNLKPVTILEVGFGAGVCPKDLYCVHMICQGSNAEDDLAIAVERLFSSDDTSSKPKVLWSLYFNQEKLKTDTIALKFSPSNGPHQELTFNKAPDDARWRVDTSNLNLDGTPENIHLCSGPDTSLDYDSAISQAHSLFSKMFPDEEFLPRAPDPDEIVFDNAGAEPKEGDNFSSEDCAVKSQNSEVDDNREKSDVSAETVQEVLENEKKQNENEGGKDENEAAAMASS